MTHHSQQQVQSACQSRQHVIHNNKISQLSQQQVQSARQPQQHIIHSNKFSQPVNHNDTSFTACHTFTDYFMFCPVQASNNALARTITPSPHWVSTSQFLYNVYWLPINKRINFKVATLTYKVLSTQQPSFLYNLISYHQSSHLLHSSSQSLLHVPRTKPSTLVAFSSAAPQIWNHIPTVIKVSPSFDSFKRHLKTRYFASP